MKPGYPLRIVSAPETNCTSVHAKPASANAARAAVTAGVPLLMLLADGDTTVSTSECLRLAEEEVERGHPVTTKVYPEVGHVFDWLDSAATRDARERVRAFLTDRLRI